VTGAIAPFCDGYEASRFPDPRKSRLLLTFRPGVAERVTASARCARGYGAVVDGLDALARLFREHRGFGSSPLYRHLLRVVDKDQSAAPSRYDIATQPQP